MAIDAGLAYPILDRSVPVAARAAQCALTVMAKAPRPGRVKTRLSPPLTPDEAAAINVCFLRDTTECLASLTNAGGAAGVISYTPVGEEELFDGLLPAGFALLPQRGDGFGERLLASAEDLLTCGYGSVCLIDSDSPTVPRTAYEAAVEALERAGDRVVLGPSDDGGYYLIGMTRAYAEVFANIAWSTATVFAETMAAAEAAGIEVELLPMWYDVDDAATLDVLRAELLRGLAPPFGKVKGYEAEHTRGFLRERERRQGAGA